VPPERLALHGFSRTVGDHLALYREIDLALDTFPYNGTTTTCEAFSMGVPVLGLAGDRHCARVGASLISSLGLADGFLAETEADYVRRAIAWAGRRAELAALRPEVCRRLLASPLCDRAGLARALEAAYREMWRRWCAEGPRCGLGPSRFEGELACASI
jgi:predicted O-linked N-acetylglucosamine transferase (SPINDLY family)